MTPGKFKTTDMTTDEITQRSIEPSATEAPATSSPSPQRSAGVPPASSRTVSVQDSGGGTAALPVNQPRKTQQKPKPKISEKDQLAQIKRAWKKLPLEKQESWLAQAARRGDPEIIRRRIEKELRINGAILIVAARFRRWLRAEHAARLQAVTLALSEEDIQEEHPDWPLNKVREELLSNAYKWSKEMEDFNTGFKTISAHCRTQTADLNERRYEDSKRSDEEKAMQFCLDATRDYPEVQELFKQAFAALEKATAGK